MRWVEIGFVALGGLVLTVILAAIADSRVDINKPPLSWIRILGIAVGVTVLCGGAFLLRNMGAGS